MGAVVWVVACVLLLVTLVDLTAFDVKPNTVMYHSSLVAVAVALLIFQVFMQMLKELPRTLWERNLIRTESDSEAYKYAAFVSDFGNLLNDRRQAALAIVLGIVGASWVVFALYNGEHFTLVSATWEFAFAFSLGMLLGLLAWRMVVSGYEIYRLGRDFDFNLQLGHPDKCGGLAPLGHLCLASASVISVAGIHLGGWLVIGPSLSPGYKALAAEYHDLYLGLLLVPLVLAPISFFVPIWAVHKEMVHERECLTKQLDQIGRKIDQLSRKALREAETTEPADLEAISKQLQGLRTTYLEYNQIPTWPFNTRIMFRFVTSQTVPLLGLTGIGAPLLKSVSSLLSFIET